MSIFELNNMQQKLFASEIINKKISIDIFFKKNRRKNQLKHALVIVLVKVLN